MPKIATSKMKQEEAFASLGQANCICPGKGKVAVIYRNLGDAAVCRVQCMSQDCRAAQSYGCLLPNNPTWKRITVG